MSSFGRLLGRQVFSFLKIGPSLWQGVPAMKPIQKPCAICLKPFERKPNIPKQKVCSRHHCQKERRRRKWRRWAKLHPDRAKHWPAKVQAWARAYPNYWRHYRRRHPGYVQRDNARRLRAIRRSRCSAKQTQWHQILVDKLRSLEMPNPLICSAKQTPYLRRVENIEDCLRSTMEVVCSAKQIPLALRTGPAG